MYEFKVDQIVDVWTNDRWLPAIVVYQFWDSGSYQVTFGDNKLAVFTASHMRAVDTPSITSEKELS